MSEEQKECLSIQHVSKYFSINKERVDVLADIDLHIKQGEFVSIVGGSGCGKSTLLKIIMGLEKADEGAIYLNGNKVTKSSIECGMAFQESRLYPWLTVEENIEFGISRKMSKEEKKKLVEEHIHLVGLDSFEKAYPAQLSGGMQQRASIARALINRPQILLLDEPFGALDALTKVNMQNEIQRIWHEENNTMLMVTHDIEEAIYLSDRVVVMSNKPGIIKEIIPVELARPRARTSEDFFRIKKKVFREFFEDTEQSVDYYI